MIWFTNGEVPLGVPQTALFAKQVCGLKTKLFHHPSGILEPGGQWPSKRKTNYVFAEA